MLNTISRLLMQLGNNQSLTGIDHNNLLESIDAIVIKKLTQTNTLIEGRYSHQTHIAITGDEMGIFDTSENSVNVVDLRQNNRFVKDFVVRNHIIILENNFSLLEGRNLNAQRSNVINSYTHAAETVRANGDIQVEISYLTLDHDEFKKLRSLLQEGDYLVFLRKRNTFEFLCLAVPKNFNLGVSRTILL
jgi:hypothetical protein